MKSAGTRFDRRENKRRKLTWFIASPAFRAAVEVTNDRTAVRSDWGRRVGPARRRTRPCQRVTLVTIHRIMAFSAFEPEQIACMRAAYEDAMDALKRADVRLSELVAKQIIEVARTGERDPDRLRQKALIELGIFGRKGH